MNNILFFYYLGHTINCMLLTFSYYRYYFEQALFNSYVLISKRVNSLIKINIPTHFMF